MRRLILALAATGGLGLILGGQTASAGSPYCNSNSPSGSCFAGMPAPVMAMPAPMLQPVIHAAPACVVGVAIIHQPPQCKWPTVVRETPQQPVDPVVITNAQPLDYLRSVKFLGAPQVNITRLHSQPPTVELSDAPAGFTGGCRPSSTHYCRQSAAPRPVVAAAPRPIITPPLAQTVVNTVVQTPMHQRRQYGHMGATPGIAHVPTSYVNRDYASTSAVLNSGRAFAQPMANGGQVPHPVMMRAPMPTMQRVAGPTMVSGMPATQVVCNRSSATGQPVCRRTAM